MTKVSVNVEVTVKISVNVNMNIEVSLIVTAKLKWLLARLDREIDVN